MDDVVFVAGARPNFVKIAPLLRELTTRNAPWRSTVVHTGQHYDFEMSGVFFEQLGIPAPDVHLNIGSGSHGVQSGRIMSAFDEYLEARTSPPRGLVVVGDVNSTMACALVAVKRGVQVAHVEAGLRSADRTMPEEINRVVTDAVADVLFVSEPAGMANLEREGVPADRIHYVGNTMIDTLVAQLENARSTAMPLKLGLPSHGYALVTLHRPVNVDSPQRLVALVQFLQRVATRLPVVFPVHPRTERKLDELGLREELAANPQIQLTSPLGYREFLGLMDQAQVVVSDSGGVQEETTYLGVPCITLRTTTERPITLTHGTNTLVGDSLSAAWDALVARLNGSVRSPTPIDGWDGRAAERIVDVLLKIW